MKNKQLALFLCLIAHIGIAVGQPQDRQPRPQPMPPVDIHTLVDNLCQSLNDHYIFPDTAAKMARFLQDQFKKGTYTAIKDPQELASRLQQDIWKTHSDGHLHLQFSPDLARDLMDTTNQEERRRIGDSLGLIDARLHNFMFSKIEILPGNIGYLKFNAFVGFMREARPTFTAAFRFLANTQALIIDLRDNGGGSPATVSQIENYFFTTPTHMNDIVDRDNHKSIFWALPSDADGVILRMPVYILTAKRTFSGAEDFSYGMQSVHRATIVGDTTGGGAHPTRAFPIGMGFVASIPTARSLNPYTNTDWEGVGVIPDIPVPAANALETAEKAIFDTWVKNASTEQDKRKYQWLWEDLAARQTPESPDSASLAAFTGTYHGGLHFYAGRTGLYCQNAERGNHVFKMTPISNDKFALDENVHVLFKKDAGGHFSAIDMCWIDGRVSSREREK